MKILLFGVSNVGNTSTGKILAQKLGFDFYDLDEEVKNQLKITLEEFVHTLNLEHRDQIRCDIIKEILTSKEDDFVFVISPISYPHDLKKYLEAEGIVMIELYDSPENIFSRLVFSDENDNIYTDEEQKKEHMDYYPNDIQSDLDWYGKVYLYLGVRNRVFVDSHSQSEAADKIIKEFIHMDRLGV